MKIRAKSHKIWEKSLRTFTNSLKIWAKMAPNMLWFEKNGARIDFFLEVTFVWFFFGKVGRIRAKFFRNPKNLSAPTPMAHVITYRSNQFDLGYPFKNFGGVNALFPPPLRACYDRWARSSSQKLVCFSPSQNHVKCFTCRLMCADTTNYAHFLITVEKESSTRCTLLDA